MSEPTQPETEPPPPPSVDLAQLEEKIRAQLNLRKSEGYQLVQYRFFEKGRHCCIVGAFVDPDISPEDQPYYKPMQEALGVTNRTILSRIESGWMSSGEEASAFFQYPEVRLGAKLKDEFKPTLYGN